MEYAEVVECGKRWVEFDREMEDLRVPPEMMDLGLVFDCGSAPKEDKHWLSSDVVATTGASLFHLHSMIYPVFWTDRYCIGRMVNTFEKMARKSAGSRVVDERFILLWDRPDPMFFFSVLLSNNEVMMMRKPLSGYLVGSQTAVYNFNRDNPFEKLEVFLYETKVECSFCSLRRVRCECSTLMIERRTLAKIPCGQKNLYNEGHSSAKSWDYLRYILRASTPSTYCFTMDSSKLKPLLSQEHVQYVPDNVSFSMLINCSSTLPTVNQLKEVHIRNLIQRSSEPLTPISFRLETTKTILDPLAHSPKKPKAEKKTCKICGGQFSRKYELQRHVQAVHESAKEYVCKICGKCFSVKNYLASHVTYVHEKKRNATCSICGSSFQTPTKLNRHHRSVHPQEKAYKCIFCSFSCLHPAELKRHLARAHANENISSPNLWV